nr:PREDICTED: APOPT family protein CBG23705, mitochondrial isoform X2 [Linepithema humile]
MLNVWHNYNYRIKYFRLGRLFCTKTSKNLRDNQQHDIIGPPDPVSNLRPVVFACSPKETYLEKKYRKLKEETQEWNQAFWSQHNINFVEERKQFQQLLKTQGKIAPTADDIRISYRLIQSFMVSPHESFTKKEKRYN